MPNRIEYTKKELMNLPSTRKEAMQTGAYHYFPNKPCKHGHIDFYTVQDGCRTCRSIRGKKWREVPKNKASKIAYDKKYKKTDAGIYSRQNYHMTSRYGITFEEYELMLKKQNGRCKICKTTKTHNKSHKRLSIDHCHKTNKIRGLICDRCNVAIGRIEDDIKRAKQIIKYLEESLV